MKFRPVPYSIGTVWNNIYIYIPSPATLLETAVDLHIHAIIQSQVSSTMQEYEGFIWGVIL